ncbi:MAG: S8 family serine peptidase [Flammeovirgaceae bacterium]|nr:MAG: S8 family serine peptidase [Flammeovirgaceae bacterium]
MVKCKLVLLPLLLGACFYASAQVNRYVVFFKDKAGTPYTINNPGEFLSGKAIQRRIKHLITANETDLPVTPSYVDDVRNAGATVLYTTRWMNGALVQCDASLLATLLTLSHVESVELVAPGPRPLNGGRRGRIKSQTGQQEDAATPQLAMLGLDLMHADGFRGENMTIAVFDGGFSGADLSVPFQHVFTEGRFNATVSHDFVYGGSDVFRHDDHGTQVWSVIAAQQDGEFTGGAHKARFQLYVTEDVDTEYRIEEYNWLIAAERADSAGVDIINSSLGYNTFDDPSMDYQPEDMNGNTAVISRAVNLAAERGIIIVTSAGNEGAKPWRIITAPADADDAIAVGNVNFSGIKSPSSSFGPTADGRIKPDVVAPGTLVKVIKANGTVGSASGTSVAAPLVTSLLAGVWQKYPHLFNSRLIEALRISSSQGASPDNSLGFGLPGYLALSQYLEQDIEPLTIGVYPNPVINDTVIIETSNPTELVEASYTIDNSMGQTVANGRARFTWNNPRYSVNLSGLHTGLYFLRIQFNGRWQTFKIVKV